MNYKGLEQLTTWAEQMAHYKGQLYLLSINEMLYQRGKISKYKLNKYKKAFKEEFPQGEPIWNPCDKDS